VALRPEEEEDDVAYRTRPEWIRFFHGAWLLSTRSFTPAQSGWYITLLAEAASEGDPPGYLPEDEAELKAIAGWTEVSRDIIAALEYGCKISEEFILKEVKRRERQWLTVRRKFLSSADHPGYVYNPRLVESIQEAYELTDQRNQKVNRNRIRRTSKYRRPPPDFKKDLGRGAAVSEGMLAHAANRVEELRRILALSKASEVLDIKELENLGIPDFSIGPEPLIPERRSPSELKREKSWPRSKALALSDDEEAIAQKDDTNRVGQEISRDRDRGSLVGLREISKSTMVEIPIPLEEIEDVIGSDNQELFVLKAKQGSKSNEVPKATRRPGAKSVPATVFAEKKFSLTSAMRQHLAGKYPELEQGDYDYLVEKFKLVYYGKRYSSWARTFYNFVGNQLTQYNYAPGSFNWRGNGKDGPHGPTRFESTAERNKRLIEENEQYSRSLLERDKPSHPKLSTSVPVAADDD
jgi:hypothetical protein